MGDDTSNPAILDAFRLDRLLPLASEPGAGRDPRCPESARWAAFATGGVGGAERARLESHLDGCAACLAEVAFLLRIDDAAPSPAVPTRLLDAARAHGPRLRVGRWRTLLELVPGPAALLVALLCLQPAIPDERGEVATAPEAVALRGAAGAREGAPAVASGPPALLRPLDGEVVAPGHLELEWRPSADATAYTVQLMNARGDVVWEGRTTGERLVVPAEAPLRSGQRLFAWVVAETRSGAAVRSPVVSLRVASD